MSDHNPATCPRCHAAQLIADALDLINPDDCTVAAGKLDVCGKFYLSVRSDDAGDYAFNVVIGAES